jgi:hypothetical protein
MRKLIHIISLTHILYTYKYFFYSRKLTSQIKNDLNTHFKHRKLFIYIYHRGSSQFVYRYEYLFLIEPTCDE